MQLLNNIGIEKKIEPSEPVVGNAYDKEIEFDALPTNLRDALRVLSQSEPMREYLGTDFVDVFVTCKEKELNPILQAAEQAIRAGTPTDATMLLRQMHRYYLALPLPVPQDTHVLECCCCFAKLILENSLAAKTAG